jgi:prepilin-type N-terminal cleavage/methylation domain-containing protein
MNRRPWPDGDCSGFTIIEVLVTCAIMAVLSTITIAGFSAWLPSYRLNTAARELYSTMQQVKITAIKQGNPCTITFPVGPDRYVAAALNNKTVRLSDYGSGVIYGGAPGSGAPIPPYTSITVNARGLPVPGAEYRVYLTNDKGSNYYMVSIEPSGVLKLLRCAPGSTIYQ